jgi:hypothetical protein
MVTAAQVCAGGKGAVRLEQAQKILPVKRPRAVAVCAVRRQTAETIGYYSASFFG